MKEDSKEVKKGSQYDHVRSVKPSGTAKQKSDYASRVSFADEAKEEERARDSESSHGEDINGKEYVNHRAGPAPNILQEDSPAVVEHEEPGAPPQTLPGAVAVGGSGHARSSADDEWSLEESQGISQQPLAMHSIEGGQHEAVSAILVDESAPDIPARVAIVDAEAEAKAQRRRSMINIMVSCGLTSLVAIVAAVVAVVLTRNKSGNETLAPFTSNPTSVPPSPSPTSVLFPFLSKNSFDNGAALLTDGSPQQQAMIWLESEQGTAEIMDTELLQIYALVTLYYATFNQGYNDQFKSRSSWLFSINNYCEWFGLTCNADKSQLLKMNLTSYTLMGSIPPEIGYLSNLLGLDLRENTLIGFIPSEIGYLSNLEFLTFSSNAIDGSLPSELGLLTSITELYLYKNQLTGPIPRELAQLANITILALYDNKLTGTLPTEIIVLSTNLLALNLENNTLKGTLPTEVGLLTNLLTLIVSYNNFTGTIPTEIGNLTILTDFEANSNDFNGTLPTEIGYLTVLTTFYVDENQLTGALPSEIGHLTNAIEFYIGKNKFTGIIPSEIGLMSALTVLSLGMNNFTGTVPTEACSIAPSEGIAVCPPLICNCSSSCKKSSTCAG